MSSDLTPSADTAGPVRFAILLVAAALSCTATADASVTSDFTQHRSNVEVTATGKTSRLLADETGPSGTHQRFIVTVDGADQTVLVDNNVNIGTRVPITVGDEVTVHGEYVWNAEGGLIHFTHHDPRHTHEGGWIDLGGSRYD